MTARDDAKKPADTTLAPDHAGAPAHSAHQGNVAPLALAALGVVFGDIGTSPLYALKECVAKGHGIAPEAGNILGLLSLIF